MSSPATMAPAQWQQIVEERSAAVWRLAYRLTGNRHDADDLTQDVFVKVFDSLDRYQPGNFSGWIHRLTTNLFLDGRRRSARQRTVAFGDGEEERIVAPGIRPESFIDDAQFDVDVEAALAELSPELRVAVILHDVEQLDLGEVAAVLGLRQSVTRSRIQRGRRQLRASLASRAPGAGRTRFLGAAAGA